MGKSKRNVSKQQSKIPKPPPLPPPPLRQTKSSPQPPPPLKSTKTVIGKEYSSETNSKYQPSVKNSPANSNSRNLAVETNSKYQPSVKNSPANSNSRNLAAETESTLNERNEKESQNDKNSTSQTAIQNSSRSKGKFDQQTTYVSKASWIPQQSEPQVDSDDSSSHDESLNEVHFFDEEECSDPDDEFLFTCCVPPYSPRYPPNPRPKRTWDPSFLPTGTNIPTSIGKPCKRCGLEVYLAELHLSSRGVYHTECYKCCLCGKSLDSWSVAEHKSELFCKGCYRRNFALHGCGFGVGAGVLQTP